MVPSMLCWCNLIVLFVYQSNLFYIYIYSMCKNRYDFAVFGFFSDEIGQVFFPPQEGNADIVESFSVFGLAFLMRPSEFSPLCFYFDPWMLCSGRDNNILTHSYIKNDSNKQTLH